MKTLFLGILGAVSLAAGAAYAGDPAVEAPIRQMETGFNKGDVALAKATHIASPTIVDEVAPFVWSGPKAFDTWFADLGKSETAEGKTDGKVAFGPPTRETVIGDRAYVFTPSTYTFKQKGRLLRETGTITFALVKLKAGWKIAAWTWTSPEGKPLN